MFILLLSWELFWKMLTWKIGVLTNFILPVRVHDPVPSIGSRWELQFYTPLLLCYLLFLNLSDSFLRCLQIVFTLLSSRRQNNMKRAMLSSFAPSWHEALYQRNSPPNGELKKHVEKISRFLFVGEKQERDEINRPFPSLYAAVKAAVRLS